MRGEGLFSLTVENFRRTMDGATCVNVDEGKMCGSLTVIMLGGCAESVWKQWAI